MTITNTGTAPDRLLAVESALAAKVEIHQSTLVDGVARMRPVPEGLSIAPGETLDLKPGGSHIMFVRPTQTFAQGNVVAARLVFERAGALDVQFRVQALGQKPAAADPHAGHGATQP